MIGANAKVIAKAEEREQFKQAMERIGLEVCRGETVHNIDEARAVLPKIGLPCVVRPSFTLGGSGSAVAYNRGEFDTLVRRGLDQSPINEVLIEESVLGWKEYEMEVMRDLDDNVVIICSIENFDPMGVHTGDSITVAPAQTLTDKEYQRMRDASIAVIREIGVETGGSNIQFAIHPQTGRMVVIEMNPRVSRSSALASKATGFPIAKIAAKLAVGYRLHELANDITRETQACFEPTIDYVVTKIPRFAFEKFPEADATLTTQMKSVGETMAIGRTFKESFQKALRGLEVGSFGLGCDGKRPVGNRAAADAKDEIRAKLATPNDERVWYMRYAMKAGMSRDEIHELTAIDPWFLDQLAQIVEMEEQLRCVGQLDSARRRHCCERQAVWFLGPAIGDDLRHARDGSAGTPHAAGDSRHLQVGRHVCGGIRGLHAVLLLHLRRRRRNTAQGSAEAARHDPGGRTQSHRAGHRVRLLLLPRQLRPARNGYRIDHGQLESRDGQHGLRHERPAVLRTADNRRRAEHLRPRAAGRSHRAVWRPDSAQPVPGAGHGRRADHRYQRGHHRGGGGPGEVPAIAASSLQLKQPANGIARNMATARLEAKKVGFPALVRPSFVLGGRAMEICYDQAQFEQFVAAAFVVAQGQPVLIDRFLEDATEVDVDAICDGEDVVVMGVMEHIEEAGVHSGDSACAIPPYSLPGPVVQEIREATHAMARHLKVIGLMNVQFAVKKEDGRHERVRAGSQSARQPDGAVCGQGHRRARGQDRRQSDGRHDARASWASLANRFPRTCRSRKASSRSGSSWGSTSCWARRCVARAR